MKVKLEEHVKYIARDSSGSWWGYKEKPTGDGTVGVDEGDIQPYVD